MRQTILEIGLSSVPDAQNTERFESQSPDREAEGINTPPAVTPEHTLHVESVQR